MKYYVLDTNLDIVDGIELFTSMIWAERYYTSGDFELYLPATKESMQFYKKAAQEHYYIVKAPERNDDLRAMSAMIIERSKLDLQFDAMDHIIITGKSLKYILNRRVLLGSTNISGNLETAIQKMVYDNAVAPIDSDRAIPRLMIGKNYIGEKGETITDLINTESTGYLDEVIESICKVYKVGWDVKIDYISKSLVFSMFKGVDRSYNQSGALSDRYPYVVFSDDYDNLLKSSFDANTEKYRNIAYIDAEYTKTDKDTKLTETLKYGRFFKTKKEGVNKEYNERGFSGLNRREMYLSGSNLVSSAKDSQTNETNLNVLDDLMRSSAEKTLENYTATVEASSEVVPNLTFGLDKDYYLGDVVSVKNSYDIKMTSRVTEVILTWTTAEHKTIPTFEVEDFDGKDDEDRTDIDETRVRVESTGYETIEGVRVAKHGEYRITKTGEFRKTALGSYVYDTREEIGQNDSRDDRCISTGKSGGVAIHGDSRKCTIRFVDMDKEVQNNGQSNI